MSRVLVAGSLHLDVVVDAPHLPRIDETVAGAGVAYRVGGKGANQAIAAARMGAPAAMAGCVGDDQFAARLLAGLDEAGVGRAQVQSAPGASGMSVAIVDAAGDYGAVTVSAANLLFDADKVQLADHAALLLQNEIAEAANIALARKARGAGVQVMLNAAPARPVNPELFAMANILLANRIEAAQLTGKPDPREAAAELARLGSGAAIVTLGADGLVLCADAEVRAMQACAAQARSTHGAGDMFAGALAAELVRAQSLHDACGFAQAAAALHVAAGASERAQLSASKARAVLHKRS